MFVAVAVSCCPYVAVPAIVTLTVGVAFPIVVPPVPLAFAPNLLLPLALLYAVVAATVAVHPTYFPTQFASVIVYFALVAPVMLVPLVAVLLVLYHH